MHGPEVEEAAADPRCPLLRRPQRRQVRPLRPGGRGLYLGKCGTPPFPDNYFQRLGGETHRSLFLKMLGGRTVGGKKCPEGTPPHRSTDPRIQKEGFLEHSAGDGQGTDMEHSTGDEYRGHRSRKPNGGKHATVMFFGLDGVGST